MGEQLHKRLSGEQVKMILDRYIKKELRSEQAMNLLGLKRSQFFELVNKYRETPDGFTIEYSRKRSSRKIDNGIEENSIKELKVELRMIPDKETGLTEIRFWHKGKLLGTQKIKSKDLKRMHL